MDAPHGLQVGMGQDPEIADVHVKRRASGASRLILI